ncbi:hypothetical protein [Rhizorhabdus histidinilytica]|uniref:hypothetical protein n=1 Tax=Rhizorhabdus histidinilytica TaxID=439228 RepID=UPI0032206839
MAIEQNTPPAAAPLSTMATLQRALERVGAAQDRRDNEGPLPKSAEVGAEFIRQTAVTELYE